MKILHVTASVSRRAGGLQNSVRRLAQSLTETGPALVSVASLEDAETAADLALWRPIKPVCFPVRGPAALGYATGLSSHLREENPDLIHAHGIWMYPSVACLKWRRHTGKPEVISPRGMLDPWALANARWKKRLAGWGFENRHLSAASCLHALCQAEADAMRAFGLRNPICVIPNGTDLPGPASAGDPGWTPSPGHRVLLYLGRIHPKKGLAPLITAWGRIHHESPALTSNWTLALAGWDQGHHLQELESLACRSGLTWHRRDAAPPGETPGARNAAPGTVWFLGPRFGADKAASYQACDAFVLPSRSEGLPMVVLEAWAHAKPVLMTPECNLPEGFTAKAALQTTTDPEALMAGLRGLMEMPDLERKAMGTRGKRLVEERFAWPRLAIEMNAVYRWLLGEGAQPDCVQLA